MKKLINKMKFNAVICIVIIALALQLSSCAKEKKAQAKTEDKEIIASDTIFDRESPYYIFIQKNNPKAIKGKLFFFEEKDIDLDGLNEAVIALGENTSSGPHINNLFVLKNDHGIIKEVMGHFNLKGKDYFANDVSLILLQDQQQSYICVKYILKYNTGISVFELTDNYLKTIRETELSNLMDNRYEESLIDEDGDGKYNGCLGLDIKDLDLSYYNKTKFVFESGVYVGQWTQYFMADYPDNIQDILLQYIRLRSLAFTGRDIDSRLNELCSDKNANQIKWNKKWYQLGVRNSFQIKNNINVDFLDIQENDDKANVIATYNLEEEKDVNGIYQLHFELEKTADKWKITKVEVLK